MSIEWYLTWDKQEAFIEGPTSVVSIHQRDMINQGQE